MFNTATFTFGIFFYLQLVEFTEVESTHTQDQMYFKCVIRLHCTLTVPIYRKNC